MFESIQSDFEQNIQLHEFVRSQGRKQRKELFWSTCEKLFGQTQIGSLAGLHHKVIVKFDFMRELTYYL